MIYLILIIIGILLFIYLKHFKTPKLNSMVLVTGGVKTGKSTLSVYFALKEYQKRLRTYKLQMFFKKILRIKRDIEKPLLYSNIPLNCDYVPLSNELLARQKRFNYKSVIYVCESSLVCDSQLIKNQELNIDLLLFNKLIGHETKGGIIIYDTQCINDNHYSVKRSLSQYFYIHHTLKIPFFIIAFVKELIYSDDNTTINVNTNDVEEGLKMILVPKRTWHYFDCYCYSKLTDNLQCETNIIHNKRKSLKASNIITFNEKLKGRFKNEKENTL